MNRPRAVLSVSLLLGCAPGQLDGFAADSDGESSSESSGGSEGSDTGTDSETETGDGDGDGDGDSSDTGEDLPVGVCGDGLVDPDEACDDGNAEPDDGCDPDCVRSGAVEIVAANAATCARTRSGAVRCWGWNSNGRLGYGHTEDIGDDETPASAGNVPLGGPAIDLSLGSVGCAVLEDHTLRCWGSGWEGMLGYGNADAVGDDETPAEVGPVPVGAPVLAVETVRYRTCAITEDQELRCWGIGHDLGYGPDGDYIVGDDETPAAMGSIEVGDPVIAVSAGFAFICALLDSQDLRCWGTDEEDLGVLGYGVPGPIETPPIDQVVPVGGPVVAAAGYDDRMCALLEGGGVRCWGRNQLPPLGYGIGVYALGDDETPAELGDLELGGPAISIAVGEHHTCAVLEGGDVRCWGGAGPWLGFPATEDIGDDETPIAAPLVPLGGPAVQVAAGDLHTCALLETGAVRCWGYNGAGGLGYGHTEIIGDDETPAEVGDVPLF